ncbi:MAG: hypothetical protein JKY56_04045 [Kofleriaceae bacterium]|nr:hypothetical protein [Kofleriaceae bacterium]
MSEQPKQTWGEMKKLYPDQWLMVVEFETNKFGDIASGVAVGHGTGKTTTLFDTSHVSSVVIHPDMKIRQTSQEYSVSTERE